MMLFPKVEKLIRRLIVGLTRTTVTVEGHRQSSPLGETLLFNVCPSPDDYGRLVGGRGSNYQATMAVLNYIMRLDAGNGAVIYNIERPTGTSLEKWVPFDPTGNYPARDMEAIVSAIEDCIRSENPEESLYSVLNFGTKIIVELKGSRWEPIKEEIRQLLMAVGTCHRTEIKLFFK